LEKPIGTWAEIYFNDSDDQWNSIVPTCPRRSGSNFPVGPYDKSLCVHKREWPPPEMAEEADRLFQASLTRMRQRRQPH